MRYTGIIVACLVLAGCQQDVERREAQDDAYCRKVVSERGGTYQDCRNNMMQYHEQKAIAAGGR